MALDQAPATTSRVADGRPAVCARYLAAACSVERRYETLGCLKS
jgi:hypothetical protein